jgi:hypothetical protein
VKTSVIACHLMDALRSDTLILLHERALASKFSMLQYNTVCRQSKFDAYNVCMRKALSHTSLEQCCEKFHDSAYISNVLKHRRHYYADHNIHCSHPTADTVTTATIAVTITTITTITILYINRCT